AALREVLRDAIDAVARAAGQRVVQRDLRAHLCGDLRDAVAHRAGADHRDRTNLVERGKRHGRTIREIGYDRRVRGAALALAMAACPYVPGLSAVADGAA